MTDSEYEEACHRAQDEAWAKCREKWREVKPAIKNGRPSEALYHCGIYRKMIASYEAKAWMPKKEGA